MEGSHATSPSAVAAVLIIQSCAPALSAMESINSFSMPDFSDATSFPEINSPMLLNFSLMVSVHRKRVSFCQEGSLYKPECDKELKPKVGMRFDDIGSVEKFYKTYAHHVGFGVRLEQQRVVDNVLQWKRLLCAKEGYRSNKVSDNSTSNHSKKRRKVKLTRCGCESHNIR